MFRSYKVGQFFGVEIKIHGTLLAVLAMVLFAKLLTEGLASAAGVAVIVAIVMASVTLHELGHIGAAALFGIGTTGLTLYPIGGIARLTREAKNSLEEVVVALAGPLVNVILASLGALGMVLSSTGFSGGFGTLVIVNLAMALFNLVPAYPMDGGRVFRGVLWKWFGKRQATLWAARGGQVFAIIFSLIGLSLGQITLFVIGVFIFFQATAEHKRAEMSMPMAVQKLTVEAAGPQRFYPQNDGYYGHPNIDEFIPETERPRGKVVFIKTPFGIVEKWEF